MISSLNGTLLLRYPESIVIDIAGVGYKVFVSLKSSSRLPAIGSKVFLFIHTSVREDDISLFGFLEEMERTVFQKLIGINGIGPKLAMTILSGIAPQELVEALHREDLVRLTAISGIGKKTAERMIVDLKDKLKELLSADTKPIEPPTGSRRIIEEATSALVNLGYHQSMAEKTLAKLPIAEEVPLENVIRQALRMLSEGGQKG